MRTLRKQYLFTLVSLLVLLASFFIGNYILQQQKITSSPTKASTPPLSGTFILLDTNQTSLGTIRELFDEMKSFGIDTVIMMNGTSYVTKDCTNNTYAKASYTTVEAYRNYLQAAKEKGFKVYLSTAVKVTSSTACTFDPVNNEGDVNSPNNDRGALIDGTFWGIGQLQSFFTSQGWDFDQPGFIEGFYIPDEINITTIDTSTVSTYYAAVTATLHTYPNKKVLLSPYMTENISYDSAKIAFASIYRKTDIDILAPQDGMGAEITTSSIRNLEHFRALFAAREEFPTKQAWANIETFDMVNPATGEYQPSTLERIVSQITTAKPYVSKQITWIYAHDFLIHASHNTTYSWTNQYTPANAVKRFGLRNRYLETYGGKPYPVKTVFPYSGNIVIKGTFGDIAAASAEVRYIKTDGTVGTYKGDHGIAHEADGDVVYISIASIPQIDITKAMDASLASTTATPTTPIVSTPLITSPVITSPIITTPPVTTILVTTPATSTPAVTTPAITTPAATTPPVTTRIPTTAPATKTPTTTAEPTINTSKIPLITKTQQEQSPSATPTDIIPTETEVAEETNIPLPSDTIAATTQLSTTTIYIVLGTIIVGAGIGAALLLKKSSV